MLSTGQCIRNESKIVETHTEERLHLDHRLDSLILLVYLILLVICVITIWTFKHRRFRYFHESGLALIYGLIVGIVLRYGMKPSKISVEYYDLPVDYSSNTTCGSRLPPQKLIVRLPVRDNYGQSFNMSFQYTFEQLAVTETPLHNKATFDPELFFNVLLPPIIFCAGYSMKRRHFFRNIGAILTYAFFGTFISAAVVGILCYVFTRFISHLSELLSFSDCLFFGSMISATDPVTVLAIFNDLGVDVDLYALVFGESVLNDALAIALSQSVEQYGSRSTGNFDTSALLSSIAHFLTMFGGSFCIGIVVGAATALLTKFTHIRDHPLLETALFVLMSYSTFLLAETIGFTGIVAVLFCGVTQAHYTYNNLSEESKLWTKQFFELLDFLSENFVFAYIGVSVFTFQHHHWEVAFVFSALFACLVARAANIYPLTALINLCRGHKPSWCKRRHHRATAQTSSINYDVFNDVLITDPLTKSTKITPNMQHMLLFSGLRGAMAFSLAIRNTSSLKRQMFFSTTIVVVMTTVLLCGSLSITMLTWLKIRTHMTGGDQPSDRSPDTGQSTSHRGKRSCFNHYWQQFDKNYLMPLLTNRGPPLTQSLPWCCQPVARLLTTQEQYNRAVSNRFPEPPKPYEPNPGSSDWNSEEPDLPTINQTLDTGDLASRMHELPKYIIPEIIDLTPDGSNETDFVQVNTNRQPNAYLI